MLFMLMADCQTKVETKCEEKQEVRKDAGQEHTCKEVEKLSKSNFVKSMVKSFVRYIDENEDDLKKCERDRNSFFKYVHTTLMNHKENTNKDHDSEDGNERRLIKTAVVYYALSKGIPVNKYVLGNPENKSDAGKMKEKVCMDKILGTLAHQKGMTDEHKKHVDDMVKMVKEHTHTEASQAKIDEAHKNFHEMHNAPEKQKPNKDGWFKRLVQGIKNIFPGKKKK